MFYEAFEIGEYGSDWFISKVQISQLAFLTHLFSTAPGVI